MSWPEEPSKWHLRLLNREELAFRRCFVAWCTQFQITHVFLEAVLVLRPSNFFKTCESLFGVAPRARRLRGTASPSAFDASSFSRLDPLRRRMNRRPRLDSASDKVFSTAASPRAFRSSSSACAATLPIFYLSGRVRTARRRSGARPARRCSRTSRGPGACLCGNQRRWCGAPEI